MNFSKTLRRFALDLHQRNIVTALLTIIMAAAWIPFDYLIDPVHATLFLYFRLSYTIVIGIALYFYWRGVWVSYTTFALFMYVVAIATILPMVLITDAKYPYYVGFSVVFVVVGLLAVWRMYYTLIPLAIVILIIFAFTSFENFDSTMVVALFLGLNVVAITMLANWMTYWYHTHNEEMMRLTHFRRIGINIANEEIIWMDERGRLVDANESALEMLGITLDSISKYSIWDFDTRFTPDTWDREWYELRTQKTLRYESTQRCKGGKVIATEVVANYFEYNNKGYNCALIRDISEYKNHLGKLEHEAHTDTLTGIYNRRRFNALANIELHEAIRLGVGVSVLMMDVDSFKKVNDTFGHAAGDKVLVKLAQVTKDTLREVDVFGRYGGEEFVVFLFATTQTHAKEVAQRILENIHKTPITIDNQEPLFVSVSIGVSFASTPLSLELLIGQADEALYGAKATGRNKVVEFAGVN